MTLYVVTKDEEPCCATFNESKAIELFDETVRANQYHQVAVLKLPSSWTLQVVMEAARFPDGRQWADERLIREME